MLKRTGPYILCQECQDAISVVPEYLSAIGGCAANARVTHANMALSRGVRVILFLSHDATSRYFARHTMHWVSEIGSLKGKYIKMLCFPQFLHSIHEHKQTHSWSLLCSALPIDNRPRNTFPPQLHTPNAMAKIFDGCVVAVSGTHRGNTQSKSVINPVVHIHAQ